MNFKKLPQKSVLFLAAASFSWLAHGMGNIHFATGNVSATDSNGGKRVIAKGSTVNTGDTINTGPGARAQIKFSDGSLVSLQPETQFRVDEYQYNGKTDGSEKGAFSLLKGGMRTITGLIGRFNRDNYKVSTPVATIGIRGTEYTVALDSGNENLAVNTGEGQVEVCNPAGCILLASGESGIVSGRQEPKRSDNKPVLPPAPSKTGPTTPVFSSSENRTASGELSSLPPPLPAAPQLQSGSGYTMAVAFWDATEGQLRSEYHTDITATFGSASTLLQAKDTYTTVTGNTIVGAFSADGIIGWGRWASASEVTVTSAANEIFGGTSLLKDLHYVIGKATPANDLVNLNGIKATYQIIGFTLPTSTTGLVGEAPSGSLALTFGAGYISNANLALNVPIGGSTYTVSGNGYGYSGGTFYGYGSLIFNGFVAGSNASHAGVTYKFDTTTSTVGEVSGAVAFKR